ncbi:phage major capsid protein [Allonocardiopsis opalescens]|uniref:HK97 family phage major capsid protein n=1 Tax=Allonocardiopsis opalescens TaxID=1144618 RepID=A0A2T0Q9X2_9ACTN|nr:phage major capsid protein [Allonocardiopsis opalescens]PRY00696.1 HK97 family phage major capsid protein [Allonocardiopsis opalescens]
MKFPALEAKQAELKKIFDEAGPDIDMSKVKSIPGTAADKVAHIKALNAEIDALKQVERAALNGGREGGSEPDGGPVAPFRKNQRMLTPQQKAVDWLASQGTKTFDEEFRLGYLGAHLKAMMGEPGDLARYRSELPAALKDMSTSGSPELVPAPIAAQLIDRLRSVSSVMASGAMTVPMTTSTLSMPRIVSDPSVSWLNEGATVTPSDGDVDAVTFTARRLTALTKVSQELAEDSNPVAVGAVLAQSMAASFAIELDRVALRGSGTPPEPDGVRNQTGVSITSAVGAADWGTLSNLAATVATANSIPTGFIWSVRTANAVGQLREDGATGAYLMPPTHIADIPRRATTAVPIDLGAGTNESEIYCGNWAELMIGIRIGFELRTLNERYADEGKIGVLGRMRADVQLRHGASFAVGTGVTN